jgi:hypothetical protein
MDDDQDPVPIFGSWPRIYAAVILSAVAVMALIAVFSRFPW